MVGKSGLSRRSFLGLSAAAIAAPALLAGCSDDSGGGAGGGGGGGSSEPLKFWNMPWGETFNPVDQRITEAYKPAEGMPPMTYQVIQWANFTQTFASAVASKTNPAVSSGGGTQAFQFEDQGGLDYVDELYETWKENGLLRRLPAGTDRHPEGGEGLHGDPVQPRHAGDLGQQGAAGSGRRQGAHGLAVLPGRVPPS